MRNDDRPAGRAFTRRDLVKLFGVSGAAASARTGALPEPADSTLALQNCIAQPQQTEGPYFVDDVLQRADVRVDPRTGRVSVGVPLELRFIVSSVSDQGACAVLPRAQVDIWHCDAAGVYSDVRDARVDTTVSSFCAALKRPMPVVSSGFRRSIPAGIPGAPCTFTSRCGYPVPAGGPTSSRRSCTSTMS